MDCFSIGLRCPDRSVRLRSADLAIDHTSGIGINLRYQFPSVNSNEGTSFDGAFRLDACRSDEPTYQRASRHTAYTENHLTPTLLTL